MIGKKVIIRADRAGVFFGTLAKKDGNEVTLEDARRIWYWDGAASISQLAVTGPMAPENCRFTMAVEEIAIIGVIEIIPCAPEAIKAIEEVRPWRR